jgi:lipoprotein NlpI
MRPVAPFLAALLVALSTRGALAQDDSLCYQQKAPPAQAIAACSALITAGTLSGHALAVVYDNRAVAYLQSDNGSDALALADLNEALRLDPGFANAYTNRGDAYDDEGKYDLALADFARALSLDPNSARTYNNRGVTYGKQGKYDLALADFNRSMTIDPTFAESYANRGTLYDSQGKYDLGLADLTHALQLEPDLYIALNDRGVNYNHRHQYDLAIADLDEALRVNPNGAQAYDNRGISHRGKGEYALAIADYDQAIRLDPTSAFAFTNRGNAYRDQGQDDLAIADYTAALRIDPNHALAYSNRGYVLVTLGRFNDAEHDFSKLVSLDATDAYATLWLHIARIRAGIDDTAEMATRAEHLDLSVWPAPIVRFYAGKESAAQTLTDATTNDQRCEAHFYLGEWQLARQRFNDARTNFQTAANTCPITFIEHAAARGELSRLPQEQMAQKNAVDLLVAQAEDANSDKNEALAIARSTAAIRLDPTRAEAYYERAIARYARGDLTGAVADYSSELRLDPTDVDGYYGRALAEYDDGAYAASVVDSTSALHRAPQREVLYDTRGLAFFGLARFADASRDFAQYVLRKRTDPYGVLFLHLARMRAGVNDASEFATNLAALGPSSWASSVEIPFFLGRMSAAQALTSAAATSDACNVDFFVAEWRLARHQPTAARPVFQSIVQTCPKTYYTTSLARAELRHPAP